MKVYVKKDYEAKLDLIQTQKAIKELKDFFQVNLARELNLTRVSAPLFVQGSTGLNDNLNGEGPVTFKTSEADDLQIVQSLAKWKRNALKRYKFAEYTGLYTDMNAIRQHEELSSIHSHYVDQWDWEKIILKSDRDEKKLEEVVTRIYRVFSDTESYINGLYPHLSKKLPENITFITSEELLQKYPDLTPKEREKEITKLHKAVFIKQIGVELSNGEKHDFRAPDYDDWKLNGDIIFYNPTTDDALELSSMGIRVCEDSLKSQLIEANNLERLELEYHQDVLCKELPYTIGGGIGQSRLCMFFLEKMHIGEVQSSWWPKEMVDYCLKHNIKLL